MGRRAASLIAALALATAGGAAAAPADDPLLPFDAGFAPKKLSKTKPTPATFDFAVKVRPEEGEALPVMKEFVLQVDRQVKVDVRGIPTCNLGGLDIRRGIGEVRKLCRPALVGSGHMEVLVQFEGQSPIPVRSEVLAINGGLEGGLTKLYLHSYFSAPVTGSIVTTMEIKRFRGGRYGIKAVASIPKIAGGNGSPTSFDLRLEKSIVSAACRGGDLAARGTAVFTDGTRRGASVVQPCVPLP